MPHMLGIKEKMWLLGKAKIYERTTNHTMRWRSIKVWTGCAACVWAILFAAPHMWWALGVSTAFPGGDTAYSTAFRNSWFFLYNLVVVILLIASALVALALVQEQRWRRLFFFFSSRRHHRMLLAAAWIACTILTFRGLIGLVVDGLTDLTFFGWPMFLTGGILFGATAAWSYSKRSSPDLASRYGSSSFSFGN